MCRTSHVFGATAFLELVLTAAYAISEQRKPDRGFVYPREISSARKAGREEKAAATREIKRPRVLTFRLEIPGI